MIELLSSIFLAVVEALRRLWQRLTGRSKSIPVPIRVRRFTSLSFSRGLIEERTRAAGFA